jgi:hypothetical protein
LSQFIPDTENELFELATKLVNESSRNIFLTGKAGTGKTTFLKFIRETCLKQMAVVAPTGVAAINAGGVTIHSFFQLPLSPFLPSGNLGNGASVDKHELLGHLKYNSEKLKVLRQVELLVIDEISMVRCDTLDAIDVILRHVRKRPHDLFGGVQILFIGDMMQLPPVIKDQEWNLLSQYYEGPYFFNSHAICAEMPVHIEFSKIYRQSEQKFISLLNQVRNNDLDEEGLEVLESRYDPNFKREDGDGYIILTTHNEKARQINQRELGSILRPASKYIAKIENEFYEKAFPADQELELKVGAQVMFIRNDSSEKGKRYFNGKIGTVTRLEQEKIFVDCNDSEKEIEVTPETWENIRYTVNPQTRALEQSLLGSFTQFPLRLAWAITIHKSQGLTFDKAIIDAGAAFAPGQVYVALSRCTNLDGLVLQTRINAASLASDRKLVEFSALQSNASQLENEFAFAKKLYLGKLLNEIFDLHPALLLVNEMGVDLKAHSKSCNEASFPWYESFKEKTNALRQVALKFATQLDAYILKEDEEGLAIFRERIQAAKGYFLQEFSVLLKLVELTPIVTDSFVHARKLNEELRELFALIYVRKRVLEKADLFNTESIQREKRNAKTGNFRVNVYAPNAEVIAEEFDHPELYSQLKNVRDAICREQDLPVYLVAGSNTLKEMTKYLPHTAKDLKKINGFGDIKVAKYGSHFLEPIIAYSEARGLKSRLSDEEIPKPGKKKVQRITGTSKPDTRQESLLLFQNGRSVAEIAGERKLAITTIENHLAGFVKTGELSLERLVSQEKIALISGAINELNTGALTPIKQRLGEAASYAEIRFVVASRNKTTSTADL